MKPMALKFRFGHTLLEIVVCVPAMTLLMLGMASAIQLARQAMPDGNSRTSATIAAGTALDQFACELAVATTISARSATDITFVTPDRNGDAAPETIRYQWAGTAGNPFTRIVNGSPAEILLPNVQDLSLTYDVRVNAGTQYCRAVNVRLIVPLGGTAQVDARLETANEPVLP
jgi:hypothetical protein